MVYVVAFVMFLYYNVYYLLLFIFTFQKLVFGKLQLADYCHCQQLWKILWVLHCFELFLCRNPNSIVTLYSLCYETVWLKMLRTEEGGCYRPFPAGQLQFHSTCPFGMEGINARKFVQAAAFSTYSATPCGNTASWHNSDFVIREI